MTPIRVIKPISFYNTVSKNDCFGFYFGFSEYTTLINNTASDNDFFKNIVAEVKVEYSSDNQWYYQETGNYWGNYTERYPNATNNGRVWNIPYKIPGTLLEDKYPLMNFFYLNPPQRNMTETDRKIDGYMIIHLFCAFFFGSIVIRKRLRYVK